jgi:predicted double-glycine peptidase
MIPEFWNEEKGFCWFEQETNVSCVPASVQMILESYGIEPLPSQMQLAQEMQTDINHTTQWEFAYLPFANRDFTSFQNESLSQNPDLALHYLKENTAKNYRILVKTWFGEIDKAKGNMTHARVITGFNETGIFFHDPSSGPNLYLYNSQFLELWDVEGNYWALVIEQDVPPELSNLVWRWIEGNLDIVALLIVGLVVEVHYVSRISNFTNSIALYLFFARTEVLPEPIGSLIIIYVVVGLLTGLIGLLSYIAKESLPKEYYVINMIFYNSLVVGAVMLIVKFFL